MVSWSPQPSVCAVQCVELFVLVVLLYKINLSCLLVLEANSSARKFSKHLPTMTYGYMNLVACGM